MIDIEEDIKEHLKGLDDYEILDYLSEVKSEDLIYFGLSILTRDFLKLKNLDLLSSIELKANLLKTATSKRFMIRGIEELYNESDVSNIREYLLPKELTFGIEIEAVGKRFGLFIRNFKYKEWRTCEEHSLCDEGLEFVSPIMTYNRKDLTEINRLCNFLLDNDFHTNDLCGGHLHFGYKYINKLNELMNLMFLYSYFEEELYLISNNERFMCRDRVQAFANSFVPVFDSLKFYYTRYGNRTTELMNSFVNSDFYAFTRKSIGLNIVNIDDPRKNTIEFRIPNGTLEYEDWHKNIILYGSLMKLAKKVSSNKDDQSDFHDFVSLKRKSEHRMEFFMNYLFEDDSIKKDYYSRYNAHLKDPTIKILELKNFDLSRHKILREIAEK